MSSSESVLRVLQLTDCHLRADPDGALLGMKTRDSLDAVLELVAQQEERPDLVLVTGDLAQEGSVAAYRCLQERLAGFPCPVVWFMGNHDESGSMHLVGEEAGLLPRSLALGHWHFIFLDSSCPGKVHGQLTESELRHLREQLDAAGDRHVLVALHHHPMPVGSVWLDAIGLRNGQDFRQLVEGRSAVKVVLWGHVHQAFDQTRDGIRWLASPSTCIQFKPQSQSFALDELAPGYRRLTLYPDGRVETEVLRVAHIDFEVDLDSKGY